MGGFVVDVLGVCDGVAAHPPIRPNFGPYFVDGMMKDLVPDAVEMNVNNIIGGELTSPSGSDNLFVVSYEGHSLDH